MSVVGLVVDGTVMVLLAVTATYCMQLNHRLKALHSDRDGLRDVVAALDRATERAQASLADLKTQGAGAAGELKVERERASEMMDELKLMVSAADRVANRLSEARGPAPAEARPVALPAPAREQPVGDMFQALRQAR
jgi:hypothetical protein